MFRSIFLKISDVQIQKDIKYTLKDLNSRYITQTFRLKLIFIVLFQTYQIQKNIFEGFYNFCDKIGGCCVVVTGFLKYSSISCKVFPLVSGTQIMVYTAPIIHTEIRLYESL